MAQVTLTFNHELNVSVEIGDIVYYVVTTAVGPSKKFEQTTIPHHTGSRENVIMIGPISSITPWDGSQSIIVADMPDDVAAEHGPPANGDFIMFSKDNKVNLSSLLGYYSLVKFRNNSTEEAELFSVGADFVESSK